MGDPRLPRRVWKKPKRPLNYDLKMSELKTVFQKHSKVVPMK